MKLSFAFILKLQFSLTWSLLTRTQPLYRERGLCQEVWIAEHVFLVDDEPQESESWVINIEDSLR